MELYNYPADSNLRRQTLNNITIYKVLNGFSEDILDNPLIKQLVDTFYNGIKKVGVNELTMN